MGSPRHENRASKHIEDIPVGGGNSRVPGGRSHDTSHSPIFIFYFSISHDISALVKRGWYQAAGNRQLLYFNTATAEATAIADGKKAGNSTP